MEATNEGTGLLDKILPPRLEDAGLEDCALPPDSIKEAFLKAASAVKSRSSTFFHEDDDEPGGCVDDPWPLVAAKDASDNLVGVPPVPEQPGPCGVVKGGGVVEEGEDKVVVVGGEQEEVVDKVVVMGGEEEEEGNEGSGCVEGLKGLSIEEKEKKEKGSKGPTLVEGVV